MLLTCNKIIIKDTLGMILNKNFINVWEDAYPEAYDIFPDKIRKDGLVRIPDLVPSQKKSNFWSR